MKNIKENEQLNVLNHSCAHLLAHAVKRLYPDALFWVGPVISDGFYYDIDLGNQVISEEELQLITKEMKKIVKENKLIKRLEISKQEALDMFENDPYKIDLIENLDSNDIISAYKQEDFVDLCRGPHVESTKFLKHFKLLKVSGAYYKGDSNNKMLQRIYGICFENEENLNQYLEMIEEAKKRDHRKLGRDLDLFFFDETAPGMPYWLPKGLKMFNTLVDFWREEHEKRGYQEFSAPQLNSSVLWKTSGHWDHYKDDMFVLQDADGVEQALKPMSCPNAILVYKSKLRSYKDLPLRFNDIDVIHRNEVAGALHGLMRVRMFRQDDSHNFIRQDQIFSEISSILEIADLFYNVFNIKFHPVLSTRPEDFMGEIEVWNEAEKKLNEVLTDKFGENGYTINPGDGAFYGPKIDLKMEDSLGREWQTGTIQLDFQLPERFDLSYIDNEGKKIKPVIVHRTIYGSLERFIGLLTEHFTGVFPLWIAPVQVMIIPVNNEFHLAYANEIKTLLEKNHIRFELNDKEEKLSYRMRESQISKIPFTLILGEKEMEAGNISYRGHGNNETVTISQESFIEMLNNKIETKS